MQIYKSLTFIHQKTAQGGFYLGTLGFYQCLDIMSTVILIAYNIHYLHIAFFI